MDEMLDELRVSHLALIEQIDQIYNCLRNYNEAKPKLRALQLILLNHFEKQKQRFYKSLFDFYLNDEEKFKQIQFLEGDIKNLKINTLCFYDEHPADMGDIKPKNFIRDFQNFSAQLSGRICDEKKYLFPLIEAIQK